jgi:hypothetical protein
MKADESADCAGRWEGRLSTGLRFFLLGPRDFFLGVTLWVKVLSVSKLALGVYLLEKSLSFIGVD